MAFILGLFFISANLNASVLRTYQGVDQGKPCYLYIHEELRNDPHDSTLGDYQVQIGQGIGFWSSYAFGKTADIATAKRTAIPLKAYTSVDENRFMRGAAVDLGYKNFEMLLFASSKRTDGSTIADSSYADLQYTS
ncbi:hypothetical protein EBR03_07105, partial [bacterium]|nr:hypothetical protein [bacterium]